MSQEMVGCQNDFLDYLYLKRFYKDNNIQHKGPQFNKIKTLEDLNNRDSFQFDEIIGVKEGQLVEYKYFHNEIDDKREFIIKKVISSFLNSDGGTLYIGITDILNVKGYNIGDFTLSEQFEDLQNIVSSIHPSPKYGSQYSITLLPIYDYLGIKLDKKIIIKIQVFDFEIKQNVYSFQLLLQDYGCETICTFYRTQDSSKFINQRSFKGMILQRSHLEPNRYDEEHKIQQHNRIQRNGFHQQQKPQTRSSSNNRYEKRTTKISKSPVTKLKRGNSLPKFLFVDNLKQAQPKEIKKRNLDQIQLVLSQITQFQQLSPILEKKINLEQTTIIIDEKNPQIDNLEKSLIASDDEDEEKNKNIIQNQRNIFEMIKQFNDQKQSNNQKLDHTNLKHLFNDRKKCLIIRKIKPECLNSVKETLQLLLKGTSGKMERLESTMIIGFDSEAELLTMKYDMMQVMWIEAVGKNIQLQFTYGEPTNQLDLERNEQMNDQEMKMLIIEKTNLRNFTILLCQHKWLLTIETLQDQTIIYQKLKQMKKKAYWRLKDKKEIKINLS